MKRRMIFRASAKQHLAMLHESRRRNMVLSGGRLVALWVEVEVDPFVRPGVEGHSGPRLCEARCLVRLRVAASCWFERCAFPP